MFFSLIQNQKISNLVQTTHQPFSESKVKIRDLKELANQQKIKGEPEDVNWIRKKHDELEEFNSLTPINISLSYNFNKKRQSNIFIRNQIITNRRSVQQNPQKGQKRFHSESVYLQQKRRKSQYSKFFNQTHVDSQHNFIGKSYLRQVKNCKISPKTHQSASVSPQKKSFPKKSQAFSRQSYFTPFSNSSTTKVFDTPKRPDSFLYINKKLSLNQRFLTQNSVQEESLEKQKNNKALVSKILIKQIQDRVKSDIKAEIKTLKSLKLNKFKLKKHQSNEFKKELRIQSSEKNHQTQKQKRQSKLSSKNKMDLITKYSDSDIKFRQLSKNSSKVRKLQSNVESYEQQCYRILNQHSIQPIAEDLRPWESETSDFFGFR